MPVFARVVYGVLGACLLLLAVYAGFTVRPLLWKPLLTVVSLLSLAGDFLSGAFTARWPLLSTPFL